MHQDLPIVDRALRGAWPTSIPQHGVGLHGTVYDVERFAALHPGGALLVHMVCGTDASALFESHHVNFSRATRALKRLPVLGTYEPTHAYDYAKYKDMREKAFATFPTRASRRMSKAARNERNALVLAMLTCHVYLLLHTTVGTCWWLCVCTLSAGLNAIGGGYGHNAVHVLSPWALLLDWNGLSAYEWLHEHVHSHHMYVNTDHDHDAIVMWPFLKWLPSQPGNPIWSVWGKHVVYAVAELIVPLQGMLVHRARWKMLDARVPGWMRLGPLVFVARFFSCVALQTGGVWTALATLTLSGYYFAFLAHLTHVHGAPSKDFVNHQLNNTLDMKAPYGPVALFLDRQRAHHLFPTIDHTRLTYHASKNQLGVPTLRLSPWELDALVNVQLSNVAR